MPMEELIYNSCITLLSIHVVELSEKQTTGDNHMKTLLHILHVEDSKEDSEMAEDLLVRSGLSCDIKRIETRDELFDSLESSDYDLILSDCTLPNFTGFEALKIAYFLKPETPFIFVSGTIGEEAAIESLRNGATDYVLKDHLSKLVPAVRRAIEEAEQHSMQRELERALRQALRLNAIATLANGMAQDFNNILTIIRGHISLLKQERDYPEHVLDTATTLEFVADRGKEIIQELLAFSRKDQGLLVLVDLNAKVQELITMLKKILPEDIDLLFDLNEGLPKIMANPSQLDRMLIHLITNAKDAMPDGGQITISISLLDADKIPPRLFTSLGNQNYLCLHVKDTGRGMDEKTQEHVFEPFFTTKQLGRGTGLGLSLVYGMMQAHNGVADIQSQKDFGTTVSLFFPVNNKREMPAPPHVPALSESTSGQKIILVVDDAPAVVSFLSNTLKFEGYQILFARDFSEALGMFGLHRDSIELVFSDIELPYLDGIQLCGKLKELKPDLKIILASGRPQSIYEKKMNDLGVQAFVSKPYNVDELLRSIGSVLDQVIIPVSEN